MVNSKPVLWTSSFIPYFHYFLWFRFCVRHGTVCDNLFSLTTRISAILVIFIKYIRCFPFYFQPSSNPSSPKSFFFLWLNTNECKGWMAACKLCHMSLLSPSSPLSARPTFLVSLPWHFHQNSIRRLYSKFRMVFKKKSPIYGHYVIIVIIITDHCHRKYMKPMGNIICKE